jgi:hypothetical protein
VGVGDPVDAVQVTDTVPEPAVVPACTLVGAFSVPVVADPLLEPVELQRALAAVIGIISASRTTTR